MVVRRDGDDLTGGDWRADSDRRTGRDGRVDTTDTADEPPRSHLTTVLLEERSDGTWQATQRGVPVDGRGETAAAAAAAYCRDVAREQ